MIASSQTGPLDHGSTVHASRLPMLAVLAVASLAVFTGGLSLLGPWLGDTLALGGHTESTVLQNIVIGEDHLRLPENMIRFEEQRRTGYSERVDLYATWPEMDGYSDENRDRFNDINRPDGLIFLQISQSNMSRDMAGRVEPIYRHLFDGPPQTGPAGLTLHRMKQGSGYGEETLFTAPASLAGAPSGYAVRCIIPAQPSLSTSGDCQSDVHAGQDLVVLYRFSSQLLPQWRAIDDAVGRFVRSRLIP